MPEAEAEFQAALKSDANNGTSLIEVAVLKHSAGRKKSEAEEIFKRLSTTDGNYKAIYGVYLFSERRRDEALREFERLFKQYPDDRSARTRLITAYRAMNRVPDAETVLQQALKKNPNDTDALLQQGELWLKAGKHTEAEAALNQVIHVKTDAAEAMYLLGKLYQVKGSSLRYKQELAKALQQIHF